MALLAVIAALLALGVFYQRAGLRRAREHFGPPGDLIDVGGHRLHARCLGEGRPVVLLESGLAASSLSWAVVQPEIAKFARVCSYDRAGLAWSDPPSCPSTFERMVQDLTMLVDAVAPGERCVLVGHSFGTFIISAYAQQHAALVAGVVLVDPPTEWLTMTRYRALLLWRGRNLSRLGAILAHIGIVRVCLALLTHGAPGAPRRLVRLLGPAAAGRVERLVGEVRKLPSEVHPIVRAHWSDPKCFHAMGSHMRALRRHHATIAAAAVPREIPVVVISGGDQPAEQLAAHRKLAEASNDGRHIVAKRSAHWIQFDQPELIVDAVRELTGSALANELG